MLLTFMFANKAERGFCSWPAEGRTDISKHGSTNVVKRDGNDTPF